MNSTVAISGQPADLCELKLCRRSPQGQWSALLLGEVLSEMASPVTASQRKSDSRLMQRLGQTAATNPPRDGLVAQIAAAPLSALSDRSLLPT